MYLKNLENQEIFVNNEVKSLSALTGVPARKGMENVIISNGKIVNIVSKRYGHLPNQVFFGKAEKMMDESGLQYVKRSLNRNDRSFVLDFIITNESDFTVKNDGDKIMPMLRFTNSYDGSEKTSGHFGFYREVCSNGLHVAKTELQFSIRHTKNNTNLVMPHLTGLFENFLENEFYTLDEKFKRMKEVEIIDTEEFVRSILEQTKLFRYECSDKNPDPSKRSKEVLELIDYESLLLDEKPNLWLGYNAFNSVLHNSLKKTFAQQKKLDRVIFNEIYSLV